MSRRTPHSRHPAADGSPSSTTTAVRGKCGPHARSLVKLNLLGDKRPALRQNFGRDCQVCRDAREGHDRRVRFKSRAGQLEIFGALLDLEAHRASFAAAVMVGFERYICRRKGLETEQCRRAHGGKKPSRPPAYPPESAEPEHWRILYHVLPASVNAAAS